MTLFSQKDAMLWAMLGLGCLSLCWATTGGGRPIRELCIRDIPQNLLLSLQRSTKKNHHEQQCTNYSNERRMEVHQLNRSSLAGLCWRGGSETFKTTTPSVTSEETSNKQLDYRDVLLCTSPQWSFSDNVDGYSNQPELPQYDDDEDSLDYDDSESDLDRNDSISRRLAHSPVVYRYYGRSRSRAHSADSIPFILLGPNVDHWKAVGKLLAARGFSVMACERVDDNDDDGEDSRKYDPEHEGRILILSILDALRWSRAILIGCDKESVLAIESAMQLAPERVAGLILCGDLSSADSLALDTGVHGLDSFLHRALDCPFMIVWDGDTESTLSKDPSDLGGTLEPNLPSSDRCLILGGGSAPHRLRPEQFAWVLTRFVEERFTPAVKKYRVSSDDLRRLQGVQTRAGSQGGASSIFTTFQLPFGLGTVVSPEGRLLIGRFVATALFYAAIMKVVVVQYGMLRSGLRSIKSRYDSVDAIRRKIFQSIGAFFVNFGYIPRLFKLKKATEDDDDDDNKTLRLKDNKETNISERKDGPSSDGSEGGNSNTKKDDNKEKILEDSESNEGDQQSERPSEDGESQRMFKPFFFLDQVVT